MDKAPLIPKEHSKVEAFDKNKYSNLLVLDSSMVQDERGSSFLQFIICNAVFESRKHRRKVSP
jgi:aromatic ring-opening dioxygenase LigB subunit